jgi:hypothetical protein
MGTAEIIGIITIGIALITNIVLISRFLTKLELKPSEIRVDEMIDERFTNHCPFKEKIDNLGTEHLEKMIDTRIGLHPVLQEYKVTIYRIDQLEPDVKQIKTDIQNILMELAKEAKK